MTLMESREERRLRVLSVKSEAEECDSASLVARSPLIVTSKPLPIVATLTSIASGYACFTNVLISSCVFAVFDVTSNLAVSVQKHFVGHIFASVTMGTRQLERAAKSGHDTAGHSLGTHFSQHPFFTTFSLAAQLVGAHNTVRQSSSLATHFGQHPSVTIFSLSAHLTAGQSTAAQLGRGTHFGQHPSVTVISSGLQTT